MYLSILLSYLTPLKGKDLFKPGTMSITRDCREVFLVSHLLREEGRLSRARNERRESANRANIYSVGTCICTYAETKQTISAETAYRLTLVGHSFPLNRPLCRNANASPIRASTRCRRRRKGQQQNKGRSCVGLSLKEAIYFMPTCWCAFSACPAANTIHNGPGDPDGLDLFLHLPPFPLVLLPASAQLAPAVSPLPRSCHL